MYDSGIRMHGGAPTKAERDAVLTEAMRAHFDDYQHAFEYDPRPMCEAFVRGARGFSFSEIERSLLGSESGGLGRTRHYQRLEEALTTSQTGAALGLIVVHAVMDAFAQAPTIFRDLAEVETSNGDSEVYPEEFMDDLPVPTAETEEAPEIRMGEGVVRIKNYGYTRALAISKRYFALDKTGAVRRFATEFGKKYPIAQDRAFINAIFRTFVPANLISNGGIIPATNIAGFGGGNGFGTGPSFAGVTGVPANFSTTAGPLTPANIENALIVPATFVDPYGVEIGAGLEFDTLLCDSLDRFKAKRFLSSSINPVQLLTSDGSGQQPGAFTDNILKGEFTVAHSPYVKRTRQPLSGAGLPWAAFKAKDNGIVMQIGKDWSVEQETPTAGRSFDQASFRWRGEGWFGVGPKTGRKTYVGN